MRRVLPFILLLCTGLMLGSFIYLLNTKINPQSNLKQLVEDKLALELKNWKGHLEVCQDLALDHRECKPVGAYSYNFQLPLQKSPASNEEKTANQANLIYRFSEEELQWLEEKNQVELVFARLGGNQLQLKLGSSAYTRGGVNFRDVVLRLKAAELIDQGSIEIIIPFEQNSRFGPLEIAPMLVQPTISPDILKMPVRTIANLNVVRGLEFSTVLFLLILAIVLDHKKSFLLLAAYFFSRMLKSFVMFYLETDNLSHIGNGMAPDSSLLPLLQGIYLIAALAALLILPLFALAVFDAPRKNRQSLVITAVAATIFSLFLIISNSDQRWIYADIFAESLAALSILLLMPGILKNSNRRKNQENLEALFNDRRRSRRFRGQQLKALFIIIASISAIWVNFVEFQSTINAGYKDTLQLSLLIMPSLLIITALIDVGFTSKTLERNASRIAQNELIAKDVQESRNFQDDLIPWKKISGRGWKARNFYYPSLTLAGDWFDITEVTIGTRTYLSCCLVDVVGHGISAGIVSSIVASQWRQWVVQLQHKPEKPDQALQSFAIGLHQALASVRNQKDCAVSAMLLELETADLWYFTAGQPPIMIENQGRFSFLSTLGDRIGLSSQVTIAHRRLENHDTMFLFTDGLIPPKSQFSRWQKKLTKELPNQPLAVWLLQQIRSNKKLFRTNRSLEDDMTALIISFAKAEEQSRHAS